MWVNRSLRTDLGWWNKSIAINRPVPLRNTPPEGVLTTDATVEQWNVTLITINTGREIQQSETWSPRWRQASSNQQETAAIYLALYRMEKEFICCKISNLRIQSDNSSAMFKLNRIAAVPALASLINMIFEQMRFERCPQSGVPAAERFSVFIDYIISFELAFDDIEFNLYLICYFDFSIGAEENSDNDDEESFMEICSLSNPFQSKL
ncbi:MAG: hypothetical protein EZS28_008411 [Streblomastix strix]|uniref:Reverse transcriptase RNase H-like domain-containing protein n=1 Tax=Streblomastix strix TaxID=222440 RepID=A0A5J4WM53_9EUKA|nr:MAG: hypothetical protein EZS28_008411 [Streblomastix strix]